MIYYYNLCIFHSLRKTMENEEKTEYQKLEEALTYSSKNIWKEVDEGTVKKIFDYGEEYRAFLTASKT